MKVIKFGGSSVANAQQIEKVAQIIKDDAKRKIVVVSAPGKRFEDDHKVTDLLIKLGHTYLDDAPYEKVYQNILLRFEEIIKDLRIDSHLIKDIKQSIDNALLHIEPSNLDALLAMGEDSSAKIVAAYLNKLGLQAKYVNPQDAGLFVSDEPGNAQVLPESYKNLYRLRETNSIQVIPGFFGYTVD